MKTIGEMRALTIEDGDIKTIWDTENEDEVEAARAQFDKFTKKGYSAFRVKKDGEKAERITKFDPDAGKIILAPALQGG